MVGKYVNNCLDLFETSYTGVVAVADNDSRVRILDGGSNMEGEFIENN